MQSIPPESTGQKLIHLLLQMGAGVSGGLLGTSLGLLSSLLITSFSASNGVALNSAEFYGISLVVLIFVTAFTANMSSLYFLTLVNKQKYKFKKHILKGGFFLNIFLFLIGLPFYLFLPAGSFLVTISAIHLFISASNSALFAEIFSGSNYAISGTIGISVAQMIFLMSYIGLGTASPNAIVTILFLPFVWMMVPIFLFITEVLYGVFREKIQ